MFTVLGFLAQVCVICVSIALFVDMHSVVSAEHDALVSAASLPQSDVDDDGYEFYTSFNGEPCNWDDSRLSMITADYYDENYCEVSIDVDESDATLPMTTSYCAKSIVPTSYTISIDEPTVFAYDYSAMTVVALKALCKSQGFKRYSSLRKHELIALLSEF